MNNPFTGVDEGAVEAEWTAGGPTRRRRWLVLGTGVPALVVTLTGMLGPLVVDIAWLPNLVLVGGVWLLLSMAFGSPRRFRATADGLERHGRVLYRFTSWRAIDGYDVTDGALVLHRTGWRPAIRWSMADVADEGAVLDVVAAHVQRC
jgi:subtilisin family serine protease